MPNAAPDLDAARRRYLGGEWRTPIFRDLVLASIPPGAVVLDIGCGHGFDSSAEAQHDIARSAGRMLGVEPDNDMPTPEWFHAAHRCAFEDAPIEPDSVDVAYSAFVLEHIRDPEAFWSALHRCLRPGGEFWGFTVDSRSVFAVASNAMERLRIKDAYLRFVQGKRGDDRYENYATYYRCNSPSRIRRYARQFQRVECRSWARPGQFDVYVPAPLRPLSRFGERAMISTGLPGSLLIVRVTK